MKRHTLFVVLVIALLLCCVSCGQGAAAGAEASAAPDTGASSEAAADADPEPGAEPEDAAEPEEATEAAESLSLDADLLTPEEAALLERLYGSDGETLTSALALSEEDAELSDGSVLTLTETRTIAGKEFYQVFNLSTSEPEGLYSLEFRTGLQEDTDDVAGVVERIYEDAVAQYGEPTTYEGISRISEWLESETAETNTQWVEEWTLSERTICRVNLARTDTIDVITVEYRMVYP